jgi:transcriptional regulator with XRE-family HTH domain
MRRNLKIRAEDLAKLVVGYRERNGLSQLELADRLGLTQATVSRIESGTQLPRKDRLEHLLNLIMHESLGPGVELINALKRDEQPNETELIFNENYTNFYSKSDWSCFYVNRQLGPTGGDVILVKDLIKKSKVGILVADSVGHGQSAAYMAVALEFAYSTIASMMAPDILSPEFFERALGLGIAKTGSSWRGEPSIELIQLDLEKNTLSIVNRGMPYPLLMDSDRCHFLTDHRASAFGLKQYTRSEGTLDLKLEAGQSILFYTDGLLDLMEETSLSTVMQRQNRLFKGDARAIGRNLIRKIKQTHTEKDVPDDISFLILSRAKKGKSNAT